MLFRPDNKVLRLEVLVYNVKMREKEIIHDYNEGYIQHHDHKSGKRGFCIGWVEGYPKERERKKREKRVYGIAFPEEIKLFEVGKVFVARRREELPLPSAHDPEIKPKQKSRYNAVEYKHQGIFKIPQGQHQYNSAARQ